MMSQPRRLVFANSVDYAPLTGGYVYNTRLMRELAGRRWDIQPLDLPAGFPRPSLAARALSARLLAALPDYTLVVADQICFSPLSARLSREAARLRLVMILHHPIGRELGLPVRAHGLLNIMEERALGLCRLVIVTSPTTAATLRTDYDVLKAVPGHRFIVYENMPHNITDAIPQRCVGDLLTFLDAHTSR
jgi:hypothetical protein